MRKSKLYKQLVGSLTKNPFHLLLPRQSRNMKAHARQPKWQKTKHKQKKKKKNKTKKKTPTHQTNQPTNQSTKQKKRARQWPVNVGVPEKERLPKDDIKAKKKKKKKKVK